MGTRCITVVKERWNITKGLKNKNKEYKLIATIYRHWDGYPDGHGKDLVKFLDGLVLVNGISIDTPKRHANGPGRLAAQLVSFLQNNGNDPSLEPHGCNSGQEYEYHILCDFPIEPSIKIEVYSGPVTFFGMGGEECNDLIFSGNVETYKKWIDNYGKEKI